MTTTKLGTLCFLSVISLSLGYMADYPGPYCAIRPGGCCDNRKDICSMPISTTLCYCDAFCDRAINGDCCPDYESYCLGAPPAENITAKCLHNGVWFGQFDAPIRDNCNLCKCHPDGRTVCETNVCLIDKDLITNVNSIHQLGWSASNYTEFWGRKYQEGLDLRLGTYEPTVRVKGMSKLTNKAERLPEEFNSFDNWSGMMSDIKDQGWCGSSWAVSTASVASDRFAIHSKGKETVTLSPQHLLSCVRRQQGCKGGHLDWAWNYFRKIGVVDDDCFPYIAASNKCKVRRTDTLASAGCRLPTKVRRNHLYRVGPAYSLNNETDIMIEIMESGPVQATMRVYRDFFAYKEGIYTHSAASRSDQGGFHSVRLVGWGVERNGYETTKYWIATNSWGTWWGEDGFFRIRRGTNECEIENYVLATWPHIHLKLKTE
ncbi:uncharacterized peptidase C1-like protein F26E4.3 isoform X2 [Bradysia coprophila]|nr:uncharacterized peptidase C1-like protein F26E4.3 isoform X2 [Bradysia coprophila]XP_037043349.1 uncharacterized peptidase C1-like protein F26E4.3 isoform X2 [Bradysia coprophila]XP_037043350.1 uncharacterized peptidase C1-like protein F26E4.3 isoform X2 [Bradysia coprophila]XP_037043351.1 uncharacterized peptidase C1-like protein F26E4.3 isoform X2 [Bradysia coprophila]XP_037043352.1 uncharacterized peptidase C1-like protein F26E4.3 isoform X2 [Bradysia coprophila]XP_037043353.1 uncharacte